MKRLQQSVLERDLCLALPVYMHLLPAETTLLYVHTVPVLPVRHGPLYQYILSDLSQGFNLTNIWPET